MQPQINHSHVTPRRSTRVRHPPARYIDKSVCYFTHEPETYQEAIEQSDSDIWKEAMDKEIQSLTKKSNLDDHGFATQSSRH